jgi:hypothetical protein
LVGEVSPLGFAASPADVASDYVPIKWAEIVLGGFDYYRYPPGVNGIQKVEHYVQSRGVPYDVIEDENLAAPADIPSTGKYALQYLNGTIRYQVMVILANDYTDASASNIDYIYWAVGNGTNAVVLGTAARLVPDLLGIAAKDVMFIGDTKIDKIDCTIHRTFNDGILEYSEGTNQTIELPYDMHSDVSNTEGKTLWYTMHSSSGRNWNGMMNTTYGLGMVFWNTLVPQATAFFWYNTFSNRWEAINLKFVAHALNFMFEQVERFDMGLLGYKRWAGAIVHRLDQDYPTGLTELNETALRAGWVVDQVIPALGYRTLGGFNLQSGLPPGYTGSPSSVTKWDKFTDIIVSTEPMRFTEREFIIYKSTTDGTYDRMKVDWNQNQDFTDDREYGVWENQTHPSVMGVFYWCYCDNFTEPTTVRLAWWSPLRDRISNFTQWKLWGQQGYVDYGFHGWQHVSTGLTPEGDDTTYLMWNGTQFVANQTYIEEKFTEARDELSYCLGSTGYGFEADKVFWSSPGNDYLLAVDKALFNLSWVYLSSGDSSKMEPGWFLFPDRKPAMSCGAGAESAEEGWRVDTWIDAVNTIFPIFGIYGHNWGSFNLAYELTPYGKMFCFAHLDDTWEFWSGSRYLKTNTLNALYLKNKIVLEYKANNTLRDYVWRFPVTYRGRYFNGFSDNRTMGKIKHIDGKYVYIEFGEGGDEKIEVIYGTYPHIYQTSSYIEEISESYSSKQLTLRLSNNSGEINVKVNCTRFAEPYLVQVNGTAIGFDYDSAARICSFNVSLNGLEQVDLIWEYAPPDPPLRISPLETDRFDPGESVRFVWKFMDPDIDDFQSAFRLQISSSYDFASPIVDTEKTTSILSETIQVLPEKVALHLWRVKTWDSRDAEGEWSDPQEVIADRLVIHSKGATRSRLNVDETSFVWFTVLREYDDLAFDSGQGTVYVDNSIAQWDLVAECWRLGVSGSSIGQRQYKVTKITDTVHNVSGIYDLAGPQQVVWDKLLVNIVSQATSVSVGTRVSFCTEVTYAYDNRTVPEYSVNVLRNGVHFAVNNFSDVSDTETKNTYTVENVTETTYGLTMFNSDPVTASWTPRSYIQLLEDWLVSNALMIVLAISFTVVFTFLYFRRARERKNSVRFGSKNK